MPLCLNQTWLSYWLGLTIKYIGRAETVQQAIHSINKTPSHGSIKGRPPKVRQESMRCFPASTTPCQQIAASKQRGLHHRLRLLQPVAISQMCDQRLPHIPGNTVPLALTKWVAKHWASLSPWCCKTGLLAHLTQWSAPHFVTVWPWTQSTRAVDSSPGERKKNKKKRYHILGGECGIFYCLQL